MMRHTTPAKDTAPHNIECDDCTNALTRRSLLSGLLIGGTSIVTAQGVSIQTAYADPSYSGDVLVILSLRGGMDGLSVIPPIGDPRYALARPTTAISSTEAIKLDNMFGLHPALTPLKPLWDLGQFAAVQAVGSMDQSRSHFLAMDEIENAAPGTSIRTGWLDRVMGLRPATTPFQETTVGSSTTERMMVGPFQGMNLSTLTNLKLNTAGTTAAGLAAWTDLTAGMHKGMRSPFETPVRTVLAATKAVSALSIPVTTTAYPNNALALALRDVAALIKGGLGIQVATLDQGDWDHHENARPRVAANLATLATAITAFAKDLGPAWQNVTIITLSEFGRRVQENGTHGFDHGHGNTMLLASGGGLLGAKVYGNWPTLAVDKLSGHEDLEGTTDYRSVIAEILTRRCGMNTADVSTAFPNFTPVPVNAFRRRAT